MLENNDNSLGENTKEEAQSQTKKTTQTEAAVSEIENVVAENSEKEETQEIPMLDYGTMELDKLVSELQSLLKK